MHLVFPEWADRLRIPCESIKHQADPVLRKEIRDIFKQNIYMAGKEPGFRPGRLGKQVIDSPYTHRIIPVKGEG